MRPRVMIVEDEGLYRDMLSSSLGRYPNLDVVGCVADGDSAIRVAREQQANVALMDIDLGCEPNGIEAGQRIRNDNPETGIVLLSSQNDRGYIDAIPLDEASGWSYISKQSVTDLSVLIKAIEGSAAGLNVMDPGSIEDLRGRQSTLLGSLSSRQVDLLALIAEGHNNTEIAKKLFLREKSVENYINILYQQLQVSRQGQIHPRVMAALIFLRESSAGG